MKTNKGVKTEHIIVLRRDKGSASGESLIMMPLIKNSKKEENNMQAEKL